MRLPPMGKIKDPTPWIVAAVVAGVLGVSATRLVLQRQAEQSKVVAEQTQPVASKTIVLSIRANGALVAIDTVNVSPKSTGRVAELLVEQGDRVRQGQIIARMESVDLEAQKAQAEAALAQAEARLAQLQAGSRAEEIAQARQAVEQATSQVAQARYRADLAAERGRRNQDLFQQGAISRDRLDEVLNEERTARASVEQSEARVRELQERLRQTLNGARPEELMLAQAQVDEALARLQAVQVQLDDTIVRAPFAGIVTQKYAVQGAFVAPTTSASATTSATSTSIATIAKGLEVLAKVPEADISRIKAGQKVKIEFYAFPGETFEGRVRLISPTAIEEQSVTSFQVRIQLESGQSRLRQGLNATLEFLGETRQNATVVPTVAIVTEKGETGVYVPGKNNRTEFRPVVIGPSVGAETQILDGLKPGEMVYIDLPKDKRPKER